MTKKALFKKTMGWVLLHGLLIAIISFILPLDFVVSFFTALYLLAGFWLIVICMYFILWLILS